MKILVIEDSPDVRVSLEQILTEGGYLVDAVSDGIEGIYRAQNWEYDAIILDVMLPKVTGWEALRTIRDKSDTPVIMLTALGELDHRLKGLNGGADDFMVKPFEPAELLARVRAVTRRRFAQSKNNIDLGTVQIDLAAKEVRRNESTVILTPAEYRILVYLAQRQGQVIRSSEIIDAVNDDENEGDTSVLKVQIYQLRKKLGKDLIVNRRNLGYTINKP
ncbi:MAG: response regulator transcription factor [Verrucomicrobiota bacterium]